jgi:hypothetical protein
MVVVFAPVSPASNVSTNAAAEEFAHLTYEAAHSPQTQRSFAQLANWFSKYEYNQIQREFLEVSKSQTDIARRRLDLARTEFEFCAARKAREYAHKFMEILANQKLDDQDKVTAAHKILFRSQPGTTASDANQTSQAPPLSK